MMTEVKEENNPRSKMAEEKEQEGEPIVNLEEHVRDDENLEKVNGAEVSEKYHSDAVRNSTPNAKTMSLQIDRRLLKSEPVNNNRERLNKARLSFQNRLLTKLGFFNSVRAREIKWGVKKETNKRRLDTQTVGK